MEKLLTSCIEEYAKDTKCERHLPSMRACLYDDGKLCECRKIIENGENNV